LNKSAYIIVVSVMILAIGLPMLNGVYATTYVNDIPNGYATWTAANNPYALTSNLVINSDETLNIQPGTVVHLNGYQIQVYGYLNAQGSSSNKISFLNDGYSTSQVIFKSQSNSACTVDFGVFYSVPITVEGGSPKIANSYFTSTSSSALITVNSGAPSITGNVLSARNSQNGIQINGGFVAIASNIVTGAHYGIYNTASTAPITSNTITNCFSGIYTTGPATIQQNIIAYNSNDGIVTQGSPDISISNNAIAHNTCGISRDANIQNNTISQNTYGLWGQTGISTIQYNNIINSGSESVHLTETAANVNAVNNWWGTTDEASIDQTISDYDPLLRSNLGNLTFKPFLTQPANAPAAPTSIVVPTPPPTPTTSTTTTLTPTPNSSTTPTTTPTPTTIITTPTYTPYPYQTIIPTPYQTLQPVQPTEEPEYGGFNLADVTTAVVIVVAVCLAVTIIVVLNRRFGQAERQQAKP
jgi:hypothetical protein